MSATETRRALTKREIDGATYVGNGRSHRIVWDGDLRGFGLRVHPSGRKAFVLFYRTPTGRKRLHTLGRYPETTLAQARKLARRRLADVLEGRDPADERRQGRQAATFAALADAYLAKHSKLHKRSARDDEQRIREYLKPAWGQKQASAVSRSDVAALHRRLAEKRRSLKEGERARGGLYVANRVLSLVSHIYAWGEREGFVPAGHPNPAHGIRRFREKSRERWLSPPEVKALFQALESEPSAYIKAFFWLMLLTGCRKTELLAARWEDVDPELGSLRLPTTKAGRVHYVPLSQPARSILEDLPREAGNPHLFPGQRAGSHLVNVEKAWRRIRKAGGAEDARLHDLRRTVGSWMAQKGASLPLIGAILNHTNASTTQVYAHLAAVDVQAAIEQHGAALLGVIGLEPVISSADGKR